MKYVIKSTWQTALVYWDGGLWRAAEPRAQRFDTKAKAQKCIDGMTWVDMSEADPAKREKPVTDVVIEAASAEVPSAAL